MMDPFTQANPFFAGSYGGSQGFGMGSPGGITPPWGGISQQGGSPFQQNPFQQNQGWSAGYGQNPYQNPYVQAIAHHLSQLPPQTWLGPLLQGSPWQQQHQFSPWGQTGFGGGQQPYGSPLAQLIPHLLLQSLYSGGQGYGQQGYGQHMFNRPPSGFGGGYPFA